MSLESTFVMIKPDGVARGLVGEVIGRFEAKNLTLTRMRMLTIDKQLAETHYAEHVDRPFFPELLSFIIGGPVVAMEWTGENAVVVARSLMGTTNPVEAAPGTIRGDLALLIGENIVHGSDSSGSASRELDIFFG